MKHPHAELMKAYADDCTLQIQVKQDGNWYDCGEALRFIKGYEYRIKPEEVKMIRVGRHEWQEPLKEIPTGVGLWSFGFFGVEHLISMTWIKAAIAEGIAHRTKEAAEQHRYALHCINRGDIN
jgi:hypothetical protein